VASDRLIAARENVWAAYFEIDLEPDRTEVFEALFRLLDDPVPDNAEPATLNYHGTEVAGFWLTLLAGRMVVPYTVTTLPSGREVIRLFVPIYLEG
jgi:hypothetical protein